MAAAASGYNPWRRRAGDAATDGLQGAATVSAAHGATTGAASGAGPGSLGGLWLLDRPGRALRRLGPAGQVVASVALPPGWEPLRFGCTALGLAMAVADRRGLDRAGPDRGGPALLFRPWQGEWRGLRLPPPVSEPSLSAATAAPATAAPATAASASTAPTTVELIDLAADPTISWMAALIRLDRADQDPAHRLVIWDGRRWRNWPAPTLTRPRHLLIDGSESVLVSEPLWGPGDSRPTPFTRLLIRPTGLEAEQSYGVRGFDGRGLWRDGDTVFASTASGGRALLRRERPLRREGRVETWALDSGSFACHWHRLFADVCLPPGTRLWVEARSADDLPPWEVRRGARPPQDRAGDKPPPPPAPPLSDPWPPLASRSAHDQEGWQLLSVPDRRPALADQPLERPSEGYGEMETLEWLVSTPPGRYLWLRLHLEGDGRQSPVLYGLRVSQPRPPLLERLPAFWRADPEAGERSERLLALFEGPLTELEHRSEALLRLFLPALTPAEALPWLAGFLALTYHDQVPERVRRQLLAEIATLYRQRGTRPGLERLLSILVEATAEAPVVIVEGFRLRRRTAALLGESSVLGPALELGAGRVRWASIRWLSIRWPSAPMATTRSAWPWPMGPCWQRAPASAAMAAAPAPARIRPAPWPAIRCGAGSGSGPIASRCWCPVAVRQCWRWCWSRRCRPTNPPTPCTSSAGSRPATAWRRGCGWGCTGWAHRPAPRRRCWVRRCWGAEPIRCPAAPAPIPAAREWPCCPFCRCVPASHDPDPQPRPERSALSAGD